LAFIFLQQRLDSGDGLEKKEITLARPIIKTIRKAAATFNNRLIAAAPTDTSSTWLQSSKHQRHVLEEWPSVYRRPSRYHLSISRTLVHLMSQGVGLFPFSLPLSLHHSTCNQNYNTI